MLPSGSIVEDNGLDWHNTLADITDADPELVIIPTAATEQHSPSQPLSTDYLRALELSRRLADALGAYLLPALPVVTSWGHIRFRGSISLGAMTVRSKRLPLLTPMAATGSLNRP
jgi:creatinine amidohydrolase/Fe(II)-dependent formamide hydrolase-like protein